MRFSFVVREKTPETLKMALEELLIGLARIRAKSNFYLPLKYNERALYMPFVDKWLPRCLTAIDK